MGRLRRKGCGRSSSFWQIAGTSFMRLWTSFTKSGTHQIRTFAGCLGLSMEGATLSARVDCAGARMVNLRSLRVGIKSNYNEMSSCGGDVRANSRALSLAPPQGTQACPAGTTYLCSLSIWAVHEHS